MATAISGSSPAYFFTFLEALSDAGVHIGLPRYMSEKLAIQAMLGSVLYAQEAIKHVSCFGVIHSQCRLSLVLTVLIC